MGARGRKESNLARSRAHKFPFSLPLLTPATQAKIFAVRRNQYGIFALVSQTSLRETSDGVQKCRLFSQVNKTLNDRVVEIICVSFIDSVNTKLKELNDEN